MGNQWTSPNLPLIVPTSESSRSRSLAYSGMVTLLGAEIWTRVT